VRFERGVDPSGQERAIERATQLLLDISGAQAGPLIVAEDPAAVPTREPVRLRPSHVDGRLGTAVPKARVEQILGWLGMAVESSGQDWLVTPPSYRFDISIEADLVEEIGRMVGYDRIPVVPGTSALRLGQSAEKDVSIDTLADLLVARGYVEVISYGFTKGDDQARILGRETAVRLANPISKDLDVLRGSLWPGLMRSARLNHSHQTARCRLFEAGTVFLDDAGELHERTCIAGLVTGLRHPVHWDGTSIASDFFDLKGDVEALLSLWRCGSELFYRPEQIPTFKPSRSAAIYRGESRVGWLGELHPALQSTYDFKNPVVLFELDLASMGRVTLPKYASFSRYPTVRRDLAVVVDEATPVADLTKHVSHTLGDALQRQEIFDVYRGVGVDSGRKSVGIGLILQDASRTLTDQETDVMIAEVVRRLEQEFGATIRS
jgi:phenylalanyl-tRNA synthetase beta chain